MLVFLVFVLTCTGRCSKHVLEIGTDVVRRPRVTVSGRRSTGIVRRPRVTVRGRRSTSCCPCYVCSMDSAGLCCLSFAVRTIALLLWPLLLLLLLLLLLRTTLWHVTGSSRRCTISLLLVVELVGVWCLPPGSLSLSPGGCIHRLRLRVTLRTLCKGGIVRVHYCCWKEWGWLRDGWCGGDEVGPRWRKRRRTGLCAGVCGSWGGRVCAQGVCGLWVCSLVRGYVSQMTSGVGLNPPSQIGPA